MSFSIRRTLIVTGLLSLSFLLSACNPLENKAKAGLQVETGDIPASLFLDDEYLEKTPFINKEIKPGTYTLKIQPDDQKLASYETEVELRKGLLTVVTWLPGARPELSGGVIYELEKIADKKQAELTIVSIPDAAILKVANREKEFAPVTISPIEPGEKEFEVSLPSYDAQKHSVNLLAGYRTTITVKLAKSSLGGTPSGTQSATSSATTKTASASAQTTATASARLAGTPPASPSPSPSAKPSISPVAGKVTPPKVVIKTTNFYQDGKEVLRVRSEATATGDTLGYAPVGNEYRYLNETVGGWRKIEFEGQTGWVSGQYVTLVE